MKIHSKHARLNVALTVCFSISLVTVWVPSLGEAATVVGFVANCVWLWCE